MTRAEILDIKALATKQGREEQGAFIAEGEKLVAEIRTSPLHIRRILQTKPIFAEGELIGEREMERISQLKTANSVLAVVEQPRYSLAEARPAKNLVLALDRVQNPGNLGTIIRLADWFGITDIVCSRDTADCFNPKVVQATMGAILRVRIHYTDLAQWLASVREARIYGTFLEGENLYSAQLDSCGVIVMGNEGQGISADVAAMVSHKILIPPYPADRHGSESLNVSVATAVICAEFRRRA
ncbi:MAG: RNA methyltransferase [Alistipes sp.]|nr:RNA methyltransferase [Alistipes sp.]